MQKLNSSRKKSKRHSQPFRQLIAEVGNTIVGQEVLIHRMLVGLLANGHLLIEGVPGLAKTTAVACLAKGIHTGFQRLQFTPDLAASRPDRHADLSAAGSAVRGPEGPDLFEPDPRR